MTKCRICHRPIKDPRSLERGVGPICYRDHGNQEDMFSPRAPVYDFFVRDVAGHRVLCIIDLYDSERPSLTVTNGAELVLAQIAEALGTLPDLIIYRDSESEWDRLKAKSDGSFKGFAPLAPGLNRRITVEQEALELAVLAASPNRARTGTH